jgi:hypothetical protein
MLSTIGLINRVFWICLPLSSIFCDMPRFYVTDRRPEGDIRRLWEILSYL